MPELSTALQDRASGSGVGVRSAEDTEQIRLALQQRYDDLHAEYEQAVAQSQMLRRAQQQDSGGDDEVDSGTKSSEHERELSLINTMLERREQVARALERLQEGSYGWCDGCAQPIPVERLAVFPAATSCVACKALRERRYG